MKYLICNLAAAAAIAATPVAAEELNVRSSHEVRFKDIVFTCGIVDERGTPRRFLSVAPYKINLPMIQPRAEDPASSGWLVVYRTICEKAASHLKCAAR